MFRFLIGRLFQGMLVLLALYTITFFLAKAMPGEPFTSEKNASAETKANIRKLYGLDQPLWKQYFVYPKNIITEGSFGVSTSKGDQWATSSRNPSPTSSSWGSALWDSP